MQNNYIDDLVSFIKDNPDWRSTLKSNYKTIRGKSFTRYITSGSKEKCDKKAEAPNEKMSPSISLKWTPHVVYKDEMGIFYTKP